jgi:hypothetical protein
MSSQQIAETPVERRAGTAPWHSLTADDAVDELPLASGWAAVVELEKGWRRRRSSDEAR